MKSIGQEYFKFRQAGYASKESYRNARIVFQWEQLESQGKVRLKADYEQDNYFSVYGEPEGYTDIHGKRITADQERKDICESIERDGCWVCYTEFLNEDSGQWEHADSVGMCVGYRRPLSPFENCYIPDLMQSAMEAYEANRVSFAI